jgi:predicted nuclease with TOPRIM domain
MEEERRTEVVQEFNFVEEPEQETISPDLEKIDLTDNQALADYFMAKNNQVDPNQLEIEKKEKELRKDIEEVVSDKQFLVDYLTNLHASIEVMEERIYELELKLEKREAQSLIPQRPSTSGMSGKGLSQLPFGLF